MRGDGAPPGSLPVPPPILIEPLTEPSGAGVGKAPMPASRPRCGLRRWVAVHCRPNDDLLPVAEASHRSSGRSLQGHPALAAWPVAHLPAAPIWGTLSLQGGAHLMANSRLDRRAGMVHRPHVSSGRNDTVGGPSPPWLGRAAAGGRPIGSGTVNVAAVVPHPPAVNLRPDRRADVGTVPFTTSRSKRTDTRRTVASSPPRVSSPPPQKRTRNAGVCASSWYSSPGAGLQLAAR